MAKDRTRHDWRCCSTEYLMLCQGCPFFDRSRLECTKDGYVITHEVVEAHRGFYATHFTVKVIDDDGTCHKYEVTDDGKG